MTGNEGTNMLSLIMRFLFLLFITTPSWSAEKDLQRLHLAYPQQIKSVNEKFIVWFDGTKMLTQNNNQNRSLSEKLDSPSLMDQMDNVKYIKGMTLQKPSNDPGRFRNEAFFRKMYGESEEDVKSKLVTIYWMPTFFGKKYPLLVTTVNNVDKRLVTISHELEQLAHSKPFILKYLDHPAGVFHWRIIAHTQRLSMHSFGFSIDINPNYGDYWQWDLRKTHQPISERTPLSYRNQIPWEIVHIFEQNNFIWGGKWYHYDTLHFEYRPELFIKS
jgi:peptidoglycan L-alanyl-D-glutamate endopeptidase CwlK